jgi:microcystin-dependent protein
MDLFFLIVFSIVIYHIYMSYKIEKMADTSTVSDQIKQAVKDIYLADVESIRNLSEVATKLQADGLTIPGVLSISGNIKTPNGNTIECAGRQHMTGNEILFLLHKQGVIIGKHWGGNGNLTVDGDVTIGGSFNLLPRGVIVAWSNAAPPAGWALCNGANGTPDLRGRFIRMASTDLINETGATAGWFDNVVGRKSNSGNIPPSVVGNSRTDTSSWIYKMNIGEYGGTDHMVLSNEELPSHSHKVNDWADSGSANTAHGNVIHRGSWYTREQDQNGGAENRNSLFDSDSGNQGNGWGHNNMPPYYVLTYIMKL